MYSTGANSNNNNSNAGNLGGNPSGTGGSGSGVGSNNASSATNYMADFPYQQNQIQQQLQQQQLHQQSQSQQYSAYGSGNPNVSGSNVSSKFTPQDIQVLRQLLGAGEKHKWKQITKDINQTSSNNSQPGDPGQPQSQQLQQAMHSPDQGDSKMQGQVKNVSPTFVIKQYQTLLGLPNNALYFGTLGSSLPYVVGANGWDDIEDQAYNHQFSDYMK